MQKAYWKVQVREIGGQKRTATYEVYTTTGKAAEGAAEGKARREYGGKWFAAFVTGPKASPFGG